MFNPNWYYNPQCFNQQAYNQMQQEMQKYQHEQSEEVAKAIKAYNDFLDAYGKLDPAHQQEVSIFCLMDIARRNNLRF